MTVAVAIAVAIGVPVGIASARYDRLQQSLRPVLDAMQTLPAFVYLIPVVLLFGVARVPAIIATVVYALPPVIRLTNLGIRTVPAATVEAAEMFGATPRQTLRKVQFPLALPSVLTGINQTIMMALSIVVIAALIGAGGLGQVVLVSLRGLFVGRALEAGLAIVVLAVIMDRVTHGAAGLGARRPLRLMPDSLGHLGAVRWIEGRLAAADQSLCRAGSLLAVPLSQKLGVAEVSRHPRKVLGGTLLVVGTAVGTATGTSEFPGAISFSIASAIDALVDWVRDNLYEIGGTWFGTGWFSDSITIYAVTPLRELFSADLAWPVVVLAVALAGWRLGGVPLATFCTVCVTGLGFLGMWELSMDTLAQVIVAVAMAIVCGIPLGVLAARSDRFERMLKPVLDFLQTIPSFVLLVPVIIMFNVGENPGDHRLGALRASGRDPAHQSRHPPGRGRGHRGVQGLRRHPGPDAAQGAAAAGRSEHHRRDQPDGDAGSGHGGDRRTRRRRWPGSGDGEGPEANRLGGVGLRGRLGHSAAGNAARPPAAGLDPPVHPCERRPVTDQQTGSATLPAGGAALGEGHRAFGGVFGDQHGLVGGQLAGSQKFEGLVQRQMPGAVADLADGSHRQGCSLHDPGGQGPGIGHDIGPADHRVDQPPAQRLGRIEAPARVEDLVGHHGREHPGQAHRGSVGHDPQRGFRQPEAGVLGGHHEVGGQHHLESAAYGHAVDRGDHRLEQAGQLAESPEAALAVVGLELLASGCRVEVPARTEEAVTGSREYRNPQIRIVAEGSEHPRSAHGW